MANSLAEPTPEDGDGPVPSHILRIDRSFRSSSEPFESVENQLNATVEVLASPGGIARGWLARSTTGFSRARMFARDVIPNMLRGRSSSSSAISPFEFGEDDFPSVFVSQDNPYDSSFGTSAGAETIELLFGPYISDAPADFHVRNNRALAELVASDPDVTAADE